MALSKKEIEYFKDQLPEGWAVVDLSGVNNVDDFVNKYVPDAFKSKGLAKIALTIIAIKKFIAIHKRNGKT